MQPKHLQILGEDRVECALLVYQIWNKSIKEKADSNLLV